MPVPKAKSSSVCGEVQASWSVLCHTARVAKAHVINEVAAASFEAFSCRLLFEHMSNTHQKGQSPHPHGAAAFQRRQHAPPFSCNSEENTAEHSSGVHPFAACAKGESEDGEHHDKEDTNPTDDPQDTQVADLIANCHRVLGFLDTSPSNEEAEKSVAG